MPVQVMRRRRDGARGGNLRDVRRVVERTLEAEDACHREVSVLLTDNREIQNLNLRWRSRDSPTDVLAFALDECEGARSASRGQRGSRGSHVSRIRDTPLGDLGDVVISVERARHQARSRGVSLESELELLAVHGTLHLLGYDHAEPNDADLMRARTRAIRRLLARARRP